MSPKEFTFTLTVPRDPHAAPLVADVASHAVRYAEMEAATGADFVTRVTAAFAAALGTPGGACAIVVTGDATALTFAMGAVMVSAPHSK
jgi:hypothetical protein